MHTINSEITKIPFAVSSKIIFFAKTVKLILTVENDTIVIFLIKKKTKLDYMHYVILKLSIESIVRRSIILRCRTMG